MAGETMNNIIEYTWNPKNRFLACGGSSGGEGALLGLKGSPIGMGTDIGGSIRIPAAFNGLYGIRPSHGRLPYEGVANSMDGQNSILSVVGPLATSAGALRLLIRGILSRDPWLHDPLVAEIPWRHEHEQFILDIARAGSKKQMCFAVMKDDGIIHPHPPIRRAIEMVISVIEKLGHRTITWAPPSHQEGIDIAGKTFMFDGGTDVRAAFALSGEPMAPAIAQNYAKQSPEYTASQIAATNVQKRQFQKKYMEYWNSTSTITGTGRPVDAVISPLAPFAAAKRDTYDYYGMYGGAFLPVTTVDKEVDVVDEGYEPKSEQDEMIHKTYDPELFDGAHVGVQIVGRRFQEEKILTITEILGHALGRLVV
ncbi:putative Acetamidase [Glarea lozoyensis 74030]|uniref:amidase n=1 Tax=Glarea lozoyensis (strain ATCC 74030 / MF5533) TaxID=1104152 RepID=H0EW71_GLAL7|nr:putative Acetamidase [Glarea lozoyensis 74030]